MNFQQLKSMELEVFFAYDHGQISYEDAYRQSFKTAGFIAWVIENI
jgi:hypothetical protein